MLACGSLGLIGLSRFLLCSVSFFCYSFQRSWSCSFQSLRRLRSFHSHHHTFYTRQAQSFIHSISLRSISFIHSCPCFSRKKNFTARQKIAPALRQSRRRPAHFVLSLSATLAPLADGSRLLNSTAGNTPIGSVSTVPFFLLRAVLPCSV